MHYDHGLFWLTRHKVPWEEAKLSVPTEAEPWPQGKDERISVNSFGVAGSNAHVSSDEIQTCDSY